MNASERVVIATLQRYFEDRGYGFARVEGEYGAGGAPLTVFFRKEGAREVQGNAYKPLLTERRAEFCFANPSRVTTYLVMRVVPSEKGLRAISWGERPRLTWQDRFVHERVLERYVGGEVEISTKGRERAHYRGVLRSVGMTVGVLTFCIDDLRINYQPADRSDMAFILSIAYARHGRVNEYQREIIDVEDGGVHYHIVFYPVAEPVTGYVGD